MRGDPPPVGLILLLDSTDEAERIGAELAVGKIANSCRVLGGRGPATEFCSGAAAGGAAYDDSPSLVLLDEALADLLPRLRALPRLSESEFVLLQDGLSGPSTLAPERRERVIAKPLTLEKLLASVAGIGAFELTLVTTLSVPPQS